MPGGCPDSSSGEDCRVQGSTAHRLGTPRLDDPNRVRTPKAGEFPVRDGSEPKTSHRYAENRNVPDFIHRPPRPFRRGVTDYAGDRVHRGEPLLLGVDKEYQVSYRLFSNRPGVFFENVAR